MSKAERDQAKNHGGFVAGVLIGGRRKADTVESKSLCAGLRMTLSTCPAPVPEAVQ